jgi:hypothetical protein
MRAERLRKRHSGRQSHIDADCLFRKDTDRRLAPRPGRRPAEVLCEAGRHLPPSTRIGSTCRLYEAEEHADALWSCPDPLGRGIRNTDPCGTARDRWNLRPSAGRTVSLARRFRIARPEALTVTLLRFGAVPGALPVKTRPSDAREEIHERWDVGPTSADLLSRSGPMRALSAISFGTDVVAISAIESHPKSRKNVGMPRDQRAEGLVRIGSRVCGSFCSTTVARWRREVEERLASGWRIPRR